MVQGGASLSTGDLRRNGLLDAQSIYDLTYHGRGKMPGYGKDCAPRVAHLLLHHTLSVVAVQVD